MLDAPPRLEKPNLAANVADLRLAGVLASPKAALRPPATTSMPLRTFQLPARKPQQGIAIDPTVGDPINVLSLSSDAVPLPPVLVIPAGSQLGRVPEPASELNAVGRATSGGPGPGANPAAGAGSGNASASGRMSGEGRRGEAIPGGSGGGSAAGGQHSGGASQSEVASAGMPGNGNGSLPVTLPPATRAALPSSVAIRTVHPNNSTYDVVVHSLSSELFPESSGVLTGRPVYTVYLPVGAPKHWILQYCVPTEAAPDQAANGNVVQLGSPAPVAAPYPLVSYRPGVHLAAGTDYMMLSGSIDGAGHFLNLKVLRGGGAQLDELVLDSLQKWEFRPATKDGRPILVEILLAIPGDEA